MFTGIVEELGHVVSREGSRIVVRWPIAASDAAIGDSVSIGGVCLTVVGLDGDRALVRHLAGDLRPDEPRGARARTIP